MNKQSYQAVHEIVINTVEDIAERTANVLQSWDTKKDRAFKISKPEAIEVAYDQHQQAKIGKMFKKLLIEFQKDIEKEVDEIGGCYS